MVAVKRIIYSFVAQGGIVWTLLVIHLLSTIYRRSRHDGFGSLHGSDGENEKGKTKIKIIVAKNQSVIRCQCFTSSVFNHGLSKWQKHYLTIKINVGLPVYILYFYFTK